MPNPSIRSLPFTALNSKAPGAALPTGDAGGGATDDSIEQEHGRMKKRKGFRSYRASIDRLCSPLSFCIQTTTLWRGNDTIIVVAPQLR